MPAALLHLERLHDEVSARPGAEFGRAALTIASKALTAARAALVTPDRSQPGAQTATARVGAPERAAAFTGDRFLRHLAMAEAALAAAAHRIAARAAQQAREAAARELAHARAQRARWQRRLDQQQAATGT